MFSWWVYGWSNQYKENVVYGPFKRLTIEGDDIRGDNRWLYALPLDRIVYSIKPPEGYRHIA